MKVIAYNERSHLYVYIKAEIIAVSLASLTTSSGLVVQATINTNVGVFTASTGIINPSTAVQDVLPDYTTIQGNVQSSLNGKNPLDLRQIDETIKRIENLAPSIAFALSMACARAAARHRGLKLYQLLAELAGTTPALPAPCINVLSRLAGPMPDGTTFSQDVSIIPTTSSSFQGGLELLMQVSRRIVGMTIESNLPNVLSTNGCPKLKASLGDILKAILNSFIK